MCSSITLCDSAQPTYRDACEVISQIFPVNQILTKKNNNENDRNHNCLLSTTLVSNAHYVAMGRQAHTQQSG